ncbi:MAG: glycosyltransferase, partial [Gemmatimonadetes bacterium]|nr:glycosyltransferase [Gemmatimonadota bacterium]NIQ53122.1 glycosyltransferase [Gemmatimonadota bacterium]NIU73268.1 glycosyltransferase [Gammaproteobacteria bacterium]NIX43531.1 glycosyltransferase [Gemmatimonadota bacterium]NIY07709.1 glycosyltransferase [Gemmatimonadota bacterium]
MALRSYHVLRQLAKRYDVDALFFLREGDPTQMPLEDRLAHLRELAEVEHFRIPGERSSVRHWWDQLRSVATRRSETRWRYDDRSFRRRVLELAFQRDPRVIHVDSIALHAHLPLLTGRTVALAHHRPESEHLRLQAELSEGRHAHYLERQAEWLEQVERLWIPRVSANIVTSARDRTELLRLAPDARVETVPAAVDTRHFTPAAGTGHGLAFVGGAATPASRDALEYFATDILPRLRRASGVQTLEPISWVGGARAGDRERYRERGIDITGYVEDIRPIVRPAACYIVPRRVAGGSTRILQAWAMGKAVVSTSV